MYHSTGVEAACTAGFVSKQTAIRYSTKPKHPTSCSCTTNILTSPYEWSHVLWYIHAGSSKTPQTLSATNAACIRYSNVTYLVSCWPPRTTEEGDIASFLVAVLGLALVAKMCPDQSQVPTNHRPSKRSITVRCFLRKEHALFFLLLNQPVPGTPRHVCKTFRANIRRSDCYKATT